jgi:hypothetical protein
MNRNLKPTDLLNPILYKSLSADARVYACWECASVWTDTTECFTCGKDGELVLVPVEEADGFPADTTMIVSATHILVQPETVESMRSFNL